MENVKLISNVITDSSYLSVSIGADTDYPEARLCDGDRYDLWQKTGTQTFGISITLPSSRPMDFLALCRHNLENENLQWRIGGSTVYNGVITGTGGAYSTTIFALGSSHTDNDATLTFSSSTNPAIAEIFLGYRGFDKHPNFPGPVPFVTPTAEVSYSRSGHRWVCKKGDEKWSIDYKFTLDDTDMSFFQQFLIDIDYGVRPFYIQDHEGLFRHVEAALPIKTPYVIPGDTSIGISPYYSLDLSVQEVF
jgi:hypothetical protein